MSGVAMYNVLKQENNLRPPGGENIVADVNVEKRAVRRYYILNFATSFVALIISGPLFGYFIVDIRRNGAFSPLTSDVTLNLGLLVGTCALVSLGCFVYNASMIFLAPRAVECAFRAMNDTGAIVWTYVDAAAEMERYNSFASQEWGVHATNRENPFQLRFNSCVPPFRQSWKASCQIYIICFSIFYHSPGISYFHLVVSPWMGVGRSFLVMEVVAPTRGMVGQSALDCCIFVWGRVVDLCHHDLDSMCPKLQHVEPCKIACCSSHTCSAVHLHNANVH
jgi:hypothetical protein